MDETPFRYDNAEIWSRMVEIVGQLRYQLDDRGALIVAENIDHSNDGGN